MSRRRGWIRKDSDEILDMIADMHARIWKITVILVSHSMEDVAKYVDRIIVMDHGTCQV